MANLTVGYLENELRKFPKGTEISVGCHSCNHSSIGTTNIIEIVDNTNQTYGYIELNLNNKSESLFELNADKEEYYKKEIEKLNKEIRTKDKKIKILLDVIESIKKDLVFLDKIYEIKEKD